MLFRSARYLDGQLDDLRIYGAALTASEVAIIHGGGFGDGGQAVHLPEIKAVSSTSLTPIPVSVTFRKYGLPSGVTGFTASDLNVTGAAVANFKVVSSSNYTFDLVPNTFPEIGRAHV